MARNSKITILERTFIPRDALIIKQGDQADCAYLVQSGAVKVYTENKGKEVELATLGVGQIFGEMALISDSPRTASVRALEDCNLIVITHQALQYKLSRSDPTVKAIVDMLMQRVMSSNTTLSRPQDDVKDLKRAAGVIYENVLAALPPEQQKIFQKSVLPKLESFLQEIADFSEKHGK